MLISRGYCVTVTTAKVKFDEVKTTRVKNKYGEKLCTGTDTTWLLY